MDIMKAAGRSSQRAALPVNALRRQRARHSRPGRVCRAAARAIGLPRLQPIPPAGHPAEEFRAG
jgi:hypothetical protein